ncbi:hypothetical protein HII28_19755 [Planctomonas sp. JC2975]|uniref:hypothetical protein n=1 Tax=Planctomonas sp. JC2975 TaxID=2729626 RepID=UPI00147315FC|nr:hypothetical protein [Planctomonas sp. JC2975]NNC14096.1 hypothetical protein [Planctomonas sp. JC2975]
MSATLNDRALGHARELIRSGKVVRDDRDDWSEDAPSTDQQNHFIDQHSWGDYAEWHLGVDSHASEKTKGRYSFPYGDFEKVHRCALISLESRAAQNDHDDIARAAKQLLDLIDNK